MPELLNYKMRPVAELVPAARNARTHSEEQVSQLAEIIKEVGFINPVVIDAEGGILAGHGRILAAQRLGLEKVPTLEAGHLSPDQQRAYMLADNKLALNASWDNAILRVELKDLKDSGFAHLTGFSGQEIKELFAPDAPERVAGSLAAKFGEPPMTVLDARGGRWQQRKLGWLQLGIKSELGRGDNALNYSKTLRTYGNKREEEASGTSIFDPVLCELAYRWFCPPGGKVLDPFAGGSVRGIVASKLKRDYLGIDLRAEQVKANEEQAKKICKKQKPKWIAGDSMDIVKLIGAEKSRTGYMADFIFSCPPYADLEVYSDDPRDISTLEYKEFRQAYKAIIAKSCMLLKQDRFACFVVGDARGKDGNYYGLPWHTIEAFEAAGLKLYNEAVLVTAVGSLFIRAGRTFESGRKLGKTHQNVLVFLKGDAKKATKAIGKVDFGEAEDQLKL